MPESSVLFPCFGVVGVSEEFFCQTYPFFSSILTDMI